MSLASMSIEDHQLRESTRRLLGDLGRMDLKSSAEFDRAWQSIVDLGLLAYAMPESAGGLSGGPIGTLSIMQEAGRALSAALLLPNVMIASRVLSRPDQCNLVKPFLEGKIRFSYVGSEHRGPPLTCISSSGTVHLDGPCELSPGVTQASHWVVAAKTERPGEALVLCMPRPEAGIVTESLKLLDGTSAERIRFDHASIPASAVVATGTQAFALVGELDDWASAGGAADAFGAAEAAFNLTLDYLKVREQFGQPIGHFQAVQHMMAEAYCSLEQFRSLLLWCGVSLLQDAEKRAFAVSAARSYLSGRGRSLIETCIQVCGGIGVSDEFPLGLYYRRLLTSAGLFGGELHHRSRLRIAYEAGHNLIGPLNETNPS